jgi:hyperosmotically inducible protein
MLMKLLCAFAFLSAAVAPRLSVQANATTSPLLQQQRQEQRQGGGADAQGPRLRLGSTPPSEGLSRSQLQLIREIRRELVTLPYYGVFDWLEYQVNPDGAVRLMGQVVRPTTKSDAEGRIKDIEGVSRVVNEIEVLPLSPNDDQLRYRLYRTLFGQNSPLFRYGLGVVPSIHIIVNRGRATLKGVVATEGDRRLAYIRARSVPGLFEVRDELQVENRRAG